MAETCKVTTAYFAGDKGTKAKDIPKEVFDHFKGISGIMKTSYFGQTNEKVGDEEVTKYCFQPAKAIPIKMLETDFKEYSRAKTLPDFKNPESSETVNGLSVSLKKDKKVFSGLR